MYLITKCNKSKILFIQALANHIYATVCKQIFYRSIKHYIYLSDNHHHNKMEKRKNNRTQHQ